jgi:MFS family permease
LICSTVVVNIIQSASGASFVTGFAWRIPFFVSALLIIVGLYVRLRIMETPLFALVRERNREASAPIAEAFRHSTPEILLSAGARFVEQAPFYLFVTFVITYGVSKLGVGRTLILNAITIAAVIELFTIPLFGYLSDRMNNRRGWYLIGCVIMAAFAFPYFLLMNSGSTALFVLAVIISLAVCHAWVYGPQAALIAERFGTRSRYSGASLGYQLASPFAGGLAPIIALVLLNGKTNLSALGLSGVTLNIGQGSWQAVSIYILILAVISFASVLGLKELSRADISSVEAYKITQDEASPAVTTD